MKSQLVKPWVKNAIYALECLLVMLIALSYSFSSMTGEKLRFAMPYFTVGTVQISSEVPYVRYTQGTERHAFTSEQPDSIVKEYLIAQGIGQSNAFESTPAHEQPGVKTWIPVYGKADMVLIADDGGTLTVRIFDPTAIFCGLAIMIILTGLTAFGLSFLKQTA